MTDERRMTLAEAHVALAEVTKKKERAVNAQEWARAASHRDTERTLQNLIATLAVSEQAAALTTLREAVREAAIDAGLIAALLLSYAGEGYVMLNDAADNARELAALLRSLTSDAPDDTPTPENTDG